MSGITFTLNTGTKIPALAWGCGSGKAKTSALESGKIALDAGFKHIDTAQLYYTEEAVGEIVAAHSLSKDDVFVTSKLSPKAKEAGSKDTVPLSKEEVRPEIEESLRKLGFTPDLFLIHNPFVAPEGSLKQYWQILEDLKTEGKLKDIGVSNFRPQDLELILDGAKYIPAVNQLEYHPYVLTHLEPVLKLHQKHNIVTAAYGPLTPILRHPSGGPLKPILTRIASRISKENTDLPISIDEIAVLLLWHRAQGVLAVTASGTPDNIRRLAAIGRLPDGLIKKEEVEEINSVGSKIHFRHYREHMEDNFPVPSLPDGILL